MSKGNKSTRTRNWTVVVYPESLPEEWIELLNSFNIEYIISPLHDSDTNGAEEEKKAHYHVLLMFGGVKTYDQVKELIKPLNCPAPQKVHNAKSLVRYFLHLDHPDKHQYNKNDLVTYGGVDISEMLRPSASERYELIAEMIEFIRVEGITEFTAIVNVAYMKRKEDWFPLLCDNSAFIINKYIQSNRHQAHESRLKD